MRNNIKSYLSLLPKEIKSIYLSSSLEPQKHKTTANTKKPFTMKIILKNKKSFTPLPNRSQKVKVKIIRNVLNLRRKSIFIRLMQKRSLNQKK